MTSDYINIHTHSHDPGNQFSVENVYVNAAGDLVPLKVNSQLKSIGIHPWYMNEETVQIQLETLERELRKGEYFALGECGIDRMKGPAIDFQEKVFAEQYRLALKYKKPMILHVVKAYADMLHFAKNYRPKIPLIIHGFIGNTLEAEKLVKHGFHLSFGEALLRERPKLKAAFLSCPLERAFFETDTSEVAIEQVYKKAAELKGISLDQLIIQVKLNFERLL